MKITKCEHGMPKFQSCHKCKRDMVPADKESMGHFEKTLKEIIGKGKIIITND